MRTPPDGQEIQEGLPRVQGIPFEESAADEPGANRCAAIQQEQQDAGCRPDRETKRPGGQIAAGTGAYGGDTAGQTSISLGVLVDGRHISRHRSPLHLRIGVRRDGEMHFSEQLKWLPRGVGGHALNE